jgi:hypothetical protein
LALLLALVAAVPVLAAPSWQERKEALKLWHAKLEALRAREVQEAA